MAGVLFFDGDHAPEIGTPVIITVDRANSPTGIWLGELTEIMGKPEAVCGRDSPDYRGAWWVLASAKITDPVAKDNEKGRTYVDCVPILNYTIFPAPIVAHGTIRMLQQRINEANAEIRGLTRRLGIEREVFHGVLRALVDRAEASQLLERLNTLLGSSK